MAQQSSMTEHDYLDAMKALGFDREQAVDLLDDALVERYEPERDNIEPSDSELATARLDALNKARRDRADAT